VPAQDLIPDSIEPVLLTKQVIAFAVLRRSRWRSRSPSPSGCTWPARTGSPSPPWAPWTQPAAIPAGSRAAPGRGHPRRRGRRAVPADRRQQTAL